MFFNYASDSDLPVSLGSKLHAIDHPLITNPTISFYAAMATGRNNGGTRLHLPLETATIAQALEVARDSEEGASDPTVINILEIALWATWAKIEAQPTSYIMTRDEFAVFNYFQSRFAGRQLAIAAIKRYWDHSRS